MLLAAIEASWPQQQIQEAAYRFQKATESKDVIVVGVNAFEKDEKVPVEVFSVDAAIEKDQVERVKAVRARRDKERATNSPRRGRATPRNETST